MEPIRNARCRRSRRRTTRETTFSVTIIVLPVAGILISVAVGKHYAERFVLVLLPVGLAIAAAILFDVVRTGEPLSYVVGAWSPPLGITLRADGISAAMLLTTRARYLRDGDFCAGDFPHAGRRC